MAANPAYPAVVTVLIGQQKGRPHGATDLSKTATYELLIQGVAPDPANSSRGYEQNNPNDSKPEQALHHEPED